MADLQARIEELWERRAELSPEDADAAVIVEQAIELLDTGRPGWPRSTPAPTRWSSTSGSRRRSSCCSRLRGMETIEAGPFEYADKLPAQAQLRRGRGARGARGLRRAGAPTWRRGVILMPSYVNIGAWVGAGTMVDTWATVAAAPRSANVHLSGGVGIGGVLEPPNAVPVVVEDDAFIGSRCMVTEGARVGRGSVLGAGAILDPSIPVIDAETGEEISRGDVPPWSVAVRASRRREFPGGEFFLPCVLVIKRLTEGERHDKAQLNQVLRDHGAST